MGDTERNHNIFQYRLSELNLKEQQEWAAIIGLTALALTMILNAYNINIPEEGRNVLFIGSFLIALGDLSLILSFPSTQKNRRVEFERLNFNQELTLNQQVASPNRLEKYIILWAKWIGILIFLTVTSVIVDTLKPLFNTPPYSIDIAKIPIIIISFFIWGVILVLITMLSPFLRKIVNVMYDDQE